MNDDNKIKTEDELIADLESLLDEAKNVEKEVNIISKDFNQEIDRKETEIDQGIKEIDNDLTELDQADKEAEVDIEKLMMEEAENITEEENEIEANPQKTE